MDNLIEKTKLIDYLFDTLPHLYKRISVTIHLEKGNWIITDHDDKILLANSDLLQVIDFIKRNQFNLTVFESIVDTVLLDDATLARMNLRRIMRFFSNEQIEQHEKQWDRFKLSLAESLNKTFKPKMSLVKEDK